MRSRAVLLPVALAAALAAALVVPTPVVSGAAAAQCQGSPEISYDIDLDIDIPKARLHHDRGIAELGRMAFHGPRGRILGVANTGLDFGWRVEFAWRPEGEAFCFWVRRTELTIHHPAPDIYVAREYRRGTCPYRAVLAHERQHIRTSRELINRYIPRLRWVLTSLRIPTGQRPVLVGSPEQAKSEVRALMKDLAEPLFREMAKALRAAQAKIDSPASYKRLFKQCKKW
ncbi:MAG: hypothetical protein IH900_14610 [Proteobacteria bacterium]|nr:hypothetical protein [Pseudomonadota bacterium]